MARARLVKDRRIAIAPGTRRVVVFDTTTGVGAECCCGGGSEECCLEGWYACNELNPPAGVIPPADYCEITVTATMRHRELFPGIGSDRITTAEVSLKIYWLEDPQNGCTTSSGDLGSQSLHAKKTINGSTVYDRTEAARLRVPPLLGHGLTSGGYLVTRWPVFPRAVGARVGSVGWLALGDVPFEASAYNDWGFYWQNLRNRPDLGWPANLLHECSGNRTGSLSGTTYSMVWSSSVSASGGSFTGTYRAIGSGVNKTEEMDVQLNWSLAFSCGQNAARSWPGCDSFVRSWLAGDAIADVNGDGVVDGDDYDAVMRAHPECVSTIDELTRARVVQIRNVRRPAVAGAVKPGDLLGLGG